MSRHTLGERSLQRRGENDSWDKARLTVTVTHLLFNCVSSRIMRSSQNILKSACLFFSLVDPSQSSKWMINLSCSHELSLFKYSIQKLILFIFYSLKIRCLDTIIITGRETQWEFLIPINRTNPHSHEIKYHIPQHANPQLWNKPGFTPEESWLNLTFFLNAFDFEFMSNLK